MIEFYIFFVTLQKRNGNMNKSTSPQSYRQELKSRILDVAMEEFWSKGVKAVKMDDIANLLTISKRTLYEIYENKEVLLLEVLHLSRKQQHDYMSEYAEKVGNNVMDIIFELYNLHAETCKRINPCLYDELKKYPKVTQYLMEAGDKEEEFAQAYFQSGIDQGYFRPELDYKAISRMMRLCVKNAILEKSRFPIDNDFVFHNIIFIFFRGFCTMKGIEEMRKKREEAK